MKSVLIGLTIAIVFGGCAMKINIPYNHEIEEIPEPAAISYLQGLSVRIGEQFPQCIYQNGMIAGKGFSGSIESEPSNTWKSRGAMAVKLSNGNWMANIKIGQGFTNCTVLSEDFSEFESAKAKMQKTLTALASIGVKIGYETNSTQK